MLQMQRMSVHQDRRERDREDGEKGAEQEIDGD